MTISSEKLKNALPAGMTLTSPNGKYTIRQVLGVGGFGITYLADYPVKVMNIETKVPVCVKEFFPSSLCERLDGTVTMSYSNPLKDQVEKSRRDFMGEARRLSALAGKHPDIVAVNEVFEANNTAYYVMEYLDGQSLDSYVKERGHLDEKEMMSLMYDIVAAVAFLHKERVTHLDIKPANVMIVAGDGDKKRPVLIDFGLSKHYNPDGSATSTINSQGYSDGFAPIEQYRGITTFSPAADVYSLGATMIYCLNGERLPASLDLTDQRVAAYIPDWISPSLRNALTHALAIHADNRLKDAGELMRLLSASAEESTQMVVTPVVPEPAIDRSVKIDKKTANANKANDTDTAKNTAKETVKEAVKDTEIVKKPLATIKETVADTAADANTDTDIKGLTIEDDETPHKKGKGKTAFIIIFLALVVGVAVAISIAGGKGKGKAATDSTYIDTTAVQAAESPMSVVSMDYKMGKKYNTRYEGAVDEENKPDGYGVAVGIDAKGNETGVRYEGYFIHGVRQGNATFVDDDGSKFVGTFDNDKASQGIVYFTDGSRFEGVIKNEKTWSGTYYDASGKTYTVKNGIFQ